MRSEPANRDIVGKASRRRFRWHRASRLIGPTMATVGAYRCEPGPRPTLPSMSGRTGAMTRLTRCRLQGLDETHQMAPRELAHRSYFGHGGRKTGPGRVHVTGCNRPTGRDDPAYSVLLEMSRRDTSDGTTQAGSSALLRFPVVSKRRLKPFSAYYCGIGASSVHQARYSAHAP